MLHRNLFDYLVNRVIIKIWNFYNMVNFPL